MDESLIPSPQLSAQLLQAERDCYVDWIDALRRIDGNPLNAQVVEFGEATAILAPNSKARIVNRVFNLSDKDAHCLNTIRDLFNKNAVDLSIDLDPFGTYEPETGLLAVMSRAGLHQSSFHQMACARPKEFSPDLPPNCRLQDVGREAARDFGFIHEKVFGPAILITPLLTHPAFHCFVAYLNDQPAALAVLHIKGKVASMANGITLPEFRSKGLQTALLRHRMNIAKDLACDLVVGQATPTNVSLRNQCRTGFTLAGTKAIWSSS
jgi:hypothetical protein